MPAVIANGFVGPVKTYDPGERTSGLTVTLLIFLEFGNTETGTVTIFSIITNVFSFLCICLLLLDFTFFKLPVIIEI